MFKNATEKVDFLKCPPLQEVIHGLPVIVWNGEDTKEGNINRVYVGMDTKNKAYMSVSLLGHDNIFKYCLKEFKGSHEGINTFVVNYLYYLSLVGYKDYYNKPKRRIPLGLFNTHYIWICKYKDSGFSVTRPKRTGKYTYYKRFL